MEKFRFGWWTTGRDQAAVNLFNAVWQALSDGTVSGQIAYVFCSRRPGEGSYSDEILALAGKRGIPAESLSAIEFEPELRGKNRQKWRELYHKRAFQLISRYECSLAVLAGYMWVLSPEICHRIDALNLHPALPGGPVGTWQEVIWQLLEKRADRTGAMMHLVTPELDKGPPVTFFSFPIKGGQWNQLWEEFERLASERGIEGIKRQPGETLQLFKRIRQEGERRELPLIVQTLAALSKGEIRLKGGRLYDAKKRSISRPLDLSEKVNASISRSRQWQA